MNRLLLTAAVFLTGATAMAQGGPGFGGPGGPGGQGGFRGGPGGPGGMRMGARTVTAASLPLKVLATYLNLDDAQVGKIALVREDAQEAMRPQMPQRRSGQEDAQPPSFQDMQARAQSADRKAASDIAGLLNDTQRRRLTTLVKAVKTLQDEGIRPDAAVKLRLSDEQLTRLASGGKTQAVLTDEQQSIAQSYTMPQGGPGFGGPGGPGGFPGGPGGPPPGFGGNQ